MRAHLLWCKRSRPLRVFNTALTPNEPCCEIIWRKSIQIPILLFVTQKSQQRIFEQKWHAKCIYAIVVWAACKGRVCDVDPGSGRVCKWVTLVSTLPWTRVILPSSLPSQRNWTDAHICSLQFPVRWGNCNKQPIYVQWNAQNGTRNWTVAKTTNHFQAKTGSLSCCGHTQESKHQLASGAVGSLGDATPTDQPYSNDHGQRWGKCGLCVYSKSACKCRSGETEIIRPITISCFCAHPSWTCLTKYTRQSLMGRKQWRSKNRRAMLLNSWKCRTWKMPCMCDFPFFMTPYITRTHDHWNGAGNW